MTTKNPMLSRIAYNRITQPLWAAVREGYFKKLGISLSNLTSDEQRVREYS